jgi:2-polyprenyl-6-methoxyphenol hydroxylase-like FAD-dependent oxidoreductase
MERVIEAEWLDQLPPEDPGAVRSRKDLQWLNAWMGSANRLAGVLRQVLPSGLPCRIADLGGGDGRFFLNAVRLLGSAGFAGQVTIVDRHNIVSSHAQHALAQLGWNVCVAQADVFAWLGQQNGQVWDVMVANLFLHHFTEAQLSRLLREAGKATRMFVAVEPRRSRVALAFSRGVGLIGCNHVTRHDAPASVLAGFSANELSQLWPQDGNWALEEGQAGWFGHLFVARRMRVGSMDAQQTVGGDVRSPFVEAARQGTPYVVPHNACEIFAFQQLPRGSLVKTVSIIGGGLAGLALGIALRRRGVPVAIWEAGHYPRHRVCGEFISGRGQEVLERLGLRELLMNAGAIAARTGVFFLGENASPVRPLGRPALCLSRFKLDAVLADEFARSGGELHQCSRHRGETGDEGFVRASGRPAQPTEGGWRWFGLKVHARNVSLSADLEMHGMREGYLGLCRLSDGETNICGLFRNRAGNGPAKPWRELFRGELGTPLHRTMANAEFDDNSFCSVAGLPLRPRRAAGQPECRIGDALTMTPPVTGNGMSMAFEAAELALEPLIAWSRGETSWTAARQAIARASDAAFKWRLLWAGWLQQLMFAPAIRGKIGRVVLGSDWFWRLMFARTR